MSVLLSNSQNPLQSRAVKNELVMGNDAKPRGVIHCGEFGPDTAGGELYRQGTKLRLQDQPLQILRILIERPG
jgi:hypothetical protein